MKGKEKIKWNSSSTLELLSAMRRFEENHRSADRTRRERRWKMIASMMPNRGNVDSDRLARSCEVRFTSICRRRAGLDEEVAKKLEEFFLLFPPGRLKDTGRLEDTYDVPLRKRGRPRKDVADASEVRNAGNTHDKSSMAGVSDEVPRSGNIGLGEARRNDAHSSVEEDSGKGQRPEESDTLRCMESVILWLKHWVTRNLVPIKNALKKPRISEKKRRKILDKCCQLKIEQLERYVGGVLADHPEYLVDNGEKHIAQECLPLRYQITMELNRVGLEMNRVRELYDRFILQNQEYQPSEPQPPEVQPPEPQSPEPQPQQLQCQEPQLPKSSIICKFN